MANKDRADSERACMSRLQEMDEALAKMEPELPDDVRPPDRPAVPPADSRSTPHATP